MVVYDSAFGSPVLYYRANTRAQKPFGHDSGGVYLHQDNGLITGCTTESVLGWDFVDTGQRHQIASFSGNFNPDLAVSGSNYITNFDSGFTNSFVNYVYNKSAYDTAGVLRPINPETFILIAAGKDGRFGTPDDITNFNISN